MWPEMPSVPRHAGWGECSLFIPRADILVAGYPETGHFAPAIAETVKTAVSERCRLAMADYSPVDITSADPAVPVNRMVA